jgi:uncharacterized membrane protein YeaQ/YmgE (transglycosylase-associated protein family)
MIETTIINIVIGVVGAYLAGLLQGYILWGKKKVNQ